MNAELEGYKQEFETQRAEVEELVARLDDDQFNWRPTPERRSVGQCLAHLNRFGYDTVLPALDELITEANTRGLYGDGPFRHGRIGNWVIRLMEPPVGMIKIPTYTSVAPPSEVSKAEVTDTFLRLQDDLIKRIERADGLDLAAVWKRMPRPVWLTLGQWFAFTAAHERRHLWQARQVMAEPELASHPF